MAMPNIACYFSPQSGLADLGHDRLSRIATGAFGSRFWGQDRLDCVAARLGALA